MATTLEALEQTIRRERSALERNVDELRTRAEAVTDWERQYRAHMGAALASAAVGGLILGALTRRAHAIAGAGPVARFATQAGDALMAVAAAAVVEFISEAIPGFREQFEGKTGG
ncbi:MAG: hypothetical protein ABI634_10705 [Acidobacteriota bacterium]